MSDYIKRSDAISILRNYIFEHGFYCDTDADKHYTAELVDSLLASTPAADVVARKKGKWVKGDNFVMCSECNKKFIDGAIYLFAKYCPECGAKMSLSSYSVTVGGTYTCKNTKVDSK